LKGKTVTNTKGFRNKIKYHLLGYVSLEKAHLCEKCGSVMFLEKMDNKGTVVQINKKGYQVHQDATMPFNWVYFKCSKCGWGLCMADR